MGVADRDRSSGSVGRAGALQGCARPAETDPRAVHRGSRYARSQGRRASFDDARLVELGRSVSELADIVSQTVLDIAGPMESSRHQRLDPGLGGGTAERGDEGVPLKRNVRVRW